MSALALSDFAPWSLSEAVVSDFVRKGAHVFEEPIDPRACAELLAEIRDTRRFDESLFLGEAEFNANPQIRGAGPKPGRNLLERLESRLGFVERAPQVVEALWSLLGPDYRILDKTIICEVPASALPEWLKRRGHGDPTRGLGAYVRPEFRDMAYAHGADFHQDLIAAPERPADFVCLHVYLHPVAEADAPVHLLEGSHRMGAAAFPHDLKRTGAGGWRYRNGACGDLFVTQRVLTGETGLAALWHGCALHGTPPAADRERIALRYRIARGAAAATGIDSVNATLAGPLRLSEARADRSAEAPASPRWNAKL
jgi:hypothetical protein